MPRGGYRKPKGARGASGPGRFSQRTDAQRPPKTPGLGAPDLQSGDVGMLERAQQAAPIAKPPIAGPPGPQGLGPAKGGLPDYMFGGTARPDEPATAGLATGEGAGPEAMLSQPSEPPQDFRELVLMAIANAFDNQDAMNMLQQLRSERSAPQAPGAVPPAPVPTA